MDDLPQITSRDNQRLVQARKVRDGHTTTALFVEGKRLTLEALRTRLSISTCFVSERFAVRSENSEILMDLEGSSQTIFELPDRVFRTVAATENSQGVIVIAERPANSVEAIENNLGSKDKLPTVLLMLRVNNPSNLGAVLRTAEAAGVAGVIITKQSTDVFSPRAIRASMGAVFRIPIWPEVDFEQAVDWAEQLGLQSTAIGTASQNSYVNADLRIPRLLIFGSEAHGIGREEMDRINESMCIPMEGGVESLNLAVAAAIVLFEAKRQQSVN